MSMIRIVPYAALCVAVMGASTAQAQACAPSPEHWNYSSFTGSNGQTTDWYTLNRESVCNASRNPSDCKRGWNRISKVLISSSASSRVYIGLTRALTWGPDSRVLADVMVPAACHVPAGGSAAVDGQVAMIGPARVGADVADPPAGADWLLTKNTSLCLGSGNDTASMVVAGMSCGGVPLEPINYNGFSFYLQGQDGNDYLNGSRGTDVLFGGNGSDQLYSRSGNDTLRGDAGNDWLEASLGDDWYLGGTGMDQHRDSDGLRDIHFGGDDSDCIFDSWSHTINGEAGSDICPSATRAGATNLTSCELLSGWCIPD